MTAIQKLTLIIEAVTDLEDAEKDTLTRNLWRELRESDAQEVTQLSANEIPPTYAKGDPALIGAVVAAVTTGTLASVISLIQNWLTRQKDQTIRVKIGDVEIEVPRAGADLEKETARLVRMIQRIQQP